MNTGVPILHGGRPPVEAARDSAVTSATSAVGKAEGRRPSRRERVLTRKDITQPCALGDGWVAESRRSQNELPPSQHGASDAHRRIGDGDAGPQPAL